MADGQTDSKSTSLWDLEACFFTDRDSRSELLDTIQPQLPMIAQWVGESGVNQIAIAV